ncbi:MAG: hypothetical protein RIT17_1487, partial [Pseudomonadota bacterium]
MAAPYPLLVTILTPLMRLLVVVPTERAAWAVAALAPVALVIAATAPGAWVIAPVLGGLLLALVVLDGMMAGRNAGWNIHAPGDVEVGQPATLAISAHFAGGRQRDVSAALACDPRLAEGGRVTFALRPDREAPGWRGEAIVPPSRRGTAPVTEAWLRWEGPLGLGARQVSYPLEQAVRIWPDLS